LLTEGPVWVPTSAESEGYLLFSDPNDNVIYRWTPDGQLSIYRTKSYDFLLVPVVHVEILFVRGEGESIGAAELSGHQLLRLAVW